MVARDAMNTHPMTKVTIVCEALARDSVLRIVESAGAHGYTLFPVEGSGARGVRPADIQEFSNIQVEVILQPPAAHQLLQRLQSDLFAQYAMVAYASEIQVLRPTKF